MKRTTVLIALAILCSIDRVDAQIAEIGYSEQTLLPLNTLRSAGKKFIDLSQGNGPFTILNLDLSVYASITPPALPPPYQASVIGNITEDLFDTDPSTIEYTVHFSDTTGGSPGPNDLGFAIYRQDGTELFFRSHGFLVAPEATPAGVIMIVDSVLNPYGPGHSHVFLLPGVLPCEDCAGNLMGTGDQQEVVPSGGDLFAFPNPSNDAAQVEYTLPAGEKSGELVLHAMNGQLVKRIPLNASNGRVQLTTAILPAATYTYEIVAGQQVIRGQRLIVVH